MRVSPSVGPRQGGSEYRKHRVRFTEASAVCLDEYALTVEDTESDPGEQRFVALGMGTQGRVLMVVYCYVADDIRIISARGAEPAECALYGERR